VKRPLLIGLAALVLAGLALGIAATDDGDSEGNTYEIVFDNAFGLTKGGDFKVAGVRAGTTSELDISGGPRRMAIVKVEVSEPGFADLRRDAHCEIRPQSFIGEYFVDCQPGSSPRRIPDGGRVPVEQTSSTIPLDLVNNIVRRPYADRLRIIVGELGAGLAGRPGDLSEVLRRAHPGLRETTQTLRILARQTRTIEQVVARADTVVGALSERRRDVSRFVREAGTTAAVAATRRDQLAASFHRLPEFLGELDPYMLRLGQLATAQQPVLRNLRAASGDLDELLTRLPPFAEAGGPAFDSLGQAAVVGRRAVRETSEELDELGRFAKDAPGLAKPLRQLLQSIDDRERAVEDDPRAAATDPPAPDKTHIAGSGGFTGMEALWNYFYWQALSTNALDDLGHVLRLNVIVNACSGYFNHRDGQEANVDQCRQWLGPSQPGINEPEPATSSSSTTSVPVAQPAALPTPDEPVLDYLLGP
jgi:virulence factor Mce-like protein